jgi:hypothetical protein
MYIVKMKINKFNEKSKAFLDALEGFTTNYSLPEFGSCAFSFDCEFDAREFAARARSPENHVHTSLMIK